MRYKYNLNPGLALVGNKEHIIIGTGLFLSIPKMAIHLVHDKKTHTRTLVVFISGLGF